MAPPTDQLHLDVEAISGICGYAFSLLPCPGEKPEAMT